MRCHHYFPFIYAESDLMRPLGAKRMGDRDSAQELECGKRTRCLPYLIESPQLSEGPFIFPMSYIKKLGLRESGNLPWFT